MGKNEIRLRRKPLTPADILRHHNYQALLERHNRSRRRRRTIRFLTFTVVVAAVILFLLLMVSYLWFRTKK